MSNPATDSNGLLLAGLEGSNPLGFLAALGTLRAVTDAWPKRMVKLNWSSYGGAWRPMLHATNPSLTPQCIDHVLDALDDCLPHSNNISAFHIADDLTIEIDVFRQAARKAADHAHESHDRRWADFLAAFGCEAFVDDTNKPSIIQDTELRTMSGAGHQHFLQFMRNLISQTTRLHLHKAMFEPWQYDDPVASMTLRWDPIDDDPYALRWRNPSGDPARQQSGSMWGAYRLAIEGLPLLPTVPTTSGLKTMGFLARGSRETYWTWPVWIYPVSLEACRSILASQLIQLCVSVQISPIRQQQFRQQLIEMGIPTLFQSQRITVGKYRSFTPARAV